MRILLTFAGGRGHLEPLIALARAAEAARHTVAFVGRPWMREQVEVAGFAAFDAGSDVGLAPVRLPLAEADLEQDMRDVGSGFARRVGSGRAADLLPLYAEWRPDVVVCEEFDFGAMVMAERLGVAHATVLISATGAFVRREFVAGPLDVVRMEHGLSSDPGLEMLSRLLVLTPFPPSLRDPGLPLPPTAHHVRLSTLDAAQDETAPPWLTRKRDTPTVYVTLGTVYNMESGDLFQRVLAGLRDLAVQVVVTVGRDLDPRELGAPPENVHVERFIPQAVLLPHCDVVVSHAGSGSVLGALTHGLPMVLVPIGADQSLNAGRCRALGVAEVLDAVRATPEMIGAAVSNVLADSKAREVAASIRHEISAMPGPEHAVTLLERLASERAPIVNPLVGR
jgi:UDP:flavonoid glycosyltransferase YjiC (YdhE family)